MDSCALLTPGFIENNRVAVAPMRINIGTDSFSDNPRLDYNAFYGLLANEPNLTAWTAAPKPEVWLEAINEASREVESVICITVAAGLSASYDSAESRCQNGYRIKSAFGRSSDRFWHDLRSVETHGDGCHTGRRFGYECR